MKRAQHHARDLGDKGMRHLQRQDLLAERRRRVEQVGELVTTRFLGEGKATIRRDTADLLPLLDRIRAIDDQLERLEKGQDSSSGG
jgi:hypothetical protein